MTTEDPQWFTSSYSSNGGDCIAVAGNLVASCGVVPVRDSKDPSGSVLELSAYSFASFVASVKAGEFGAV
ncbi:DUF397 domain-containing protein [Streptomyces sp. NBC_00878]|uniref:DUF397 domain-containing protein n=1 Tax=Streptomyces sp. NBC_00878 TaxID=2975854 RepID=UPI00225095EA|nr:DUF397 domain-containing protein [Streptomyces sp. NBC_00878]MCX4908953.1 DUF397 domain-containing protein [Streptomyces sp. NBC_00878]